MKIIDVRKIPLCDVLDTIESGSRPKGGVTLSGDTPSFGGENITADGRLNCDEVKRVTQGFFIAMLRGHLQHGDVLINKDGAQTGKVAIFEGGFQDACINEHLFLLRGKKDCLEQRFLYHALIWDNCQQQVRRIRTGSAQAGINTKFPAAVEIPLPLIWEQRSIVSILDLLDRVIMRTELLISKLKAIRSGLLHILFSYGLSQDGIIREYKTHPDNFRPSAIGVLPKSWEIATFDEITDAKAPICYGIVQPGSYSPDGVPVVTIGDLYGDYGADLHRTAKTIDFMYDRSRIVPSDILLSIKGTIGRVDIVPNHFNGNISRDIARIRVRNGIHPKYIRYMLEAPQCQRRLQAAIVGTTRPELSIKVLKRLLLPLAPYPEQEKITIVIEEHTTPISLEEAHLSKLRAIKKGIMQDLLTGRVRVTQGEAVQTKR